MTSQAEVMATAKPQKIENGWVVAMPTEMAEAFGLPEGTIAILYAKPGNVFAQIHFDTMDFFGEIRYGVYLRELIESTLARPQNSAAQAATLCFGLIKNHPLYGGNKRTATAITEAFLRLNGYRVNATLGEVARLAYAIEDNSFGLDEIEAWYRQRSTPTR